MWGAWACPHGEISIHAPREGGDDYNECFFFRGSNISIHAPREGGDRGIRTRNTWYKDFNPRPPRGGRLASGSTQAWHCYFNPRPPRGGRPCNKFNLFLVQSISIHAPREGGDSKDAQFYLRIFDKQVEILRFWGKIRGGCLRNPEKDRRFLGKSLANLPEISGHLDFAGGREGASRIPVRRTTAAPGGVCQRIRGSSGR